MCHFQCFCCSKYYCLEQFCASVLQLTGQVTSRTVGSQDTQTCFQSHCSEMYSPQPSLRMPDIHILTDLGDRPTFLNASQLSVKGHLMVVLFCIYIFTRKSGHLSVSSSLKQVFRPFMFPLTFLIMLFFFLTDLQKFFIYLRYQSFLKNDCLLSVCSFSQVKIK